MPMLNPGIVCGSPMLASSFFITKRSETVAADGVVSVGSSETIPASGVVVWASGRDRQVLPEAIQNAAAIAVVSNFELSGETPNHQADIITWRGTDYRVIECRPYPQFGMGYYKVVAASENMSNLAPTPAGACDG